MKASYLLSFIIMFLELINKIRIRVNNEYVLRTLLLFYRDGNTVVTSSDDGHCNVFDVSSILQTASNTDS